MTDPAHSRTEVPTLLIAHRRVGKTNAQRRWLENRIAAGKHVHCLSVDGAECFNGPDGPCNFDMPLAGEPIL